MGVGSCCEGTSCRASRAAVTRISMPITVTYRLRGPVAEAESRAHALLIEQSVETPLSVANRYPFVREHLLGRVEAVEAMGDNEALVRLALPEGVAATDAAQLVNVLFGNVSIHEGVTLEDFSLPGDLLAQYPGPRHGIAGWRQRTGVTGRPLVCSALKPVGLDVDQLADLMAAFAEGGIDVVKDDHYLADHAFAPFEPRVKKMLEVTAHAAERSGRRTLYVPNLSGTPEQMRRQAEMAQTLGAEAVMVAPMLAGLPFLYELTSRHLSVPLLAHPSFGGNGHIALPTLIGKLFRLFGADAAIFAGYGGRFGVSPATCRAIADAARAPWGALKPALPVPAGGMTRERAAELVRFYGPDTMLLVGGSLLEAGPALAEETRRLVEQTAAQA